MNNRSNTSIARNRGSAKRQWPANSPRRGGWVCGLFPVLLAVASAADLKSANPIHFIGIEQFTAFERTTNAGMVVLTSPWLTAPRAWNELVVSWNAAGPPGSHLKIEARASSGNLVTPFYGLGLWSPDPARHPRESVRNQKDAHAEVRTDILICRERMERVQVRVSLGGDGEPPRLKFLGICLSDSTAPPLELPENRAAWGKLIEVPQRSQLGHQGAEGWCSPTAVSMVLAHWGKVLDRPELDVPVPAVAKAVHDRNWEGTGNWVFNTAFAGEFDSLRSYVARLGDISELEDWVAADIPVIASVSFDLLNGRPKDEGTGHLIVVVGFTKNGDVVINDPWPNPKRENSVRKTIPRQNVVRAWQRSKRAVYLIYPLQARIPENRFNHWAGNNVQ